MTNLQLIILYLVGGVSFFFLGMMFSDRVWRRIYKETKLAEFRRGWDAGFGFVNRIESVKAENVSSVKVFGRKVTDNG